MLFNLCMHKSIYLEAVYRLQIERYLNTEISVTRTASLNEKQKIPCYFDIPQSLKFAVKLISF